MDAFHTIGTDLNTRARTSDKSWQARWFHFAMWLAIIAMFVIFLRAVEPILLPFVLGMLVAYIVDPLAVWLQRFGMGRTLSTAIITLSLFTLIGAITVWLAPILFEQLSTLIARAPRLIHGVEMQLRDQLSPLLKNLNQLTGGDTSPDAIPVDASDLVQRALDAFSLSTQKVFASGAALINVVALLMITPIVCFYLIRDWPAMIRGVDKMLPLAYAPTIRTQLYLINRTLAGYVRGQSLVMSILSVYYVIALALCGLHFALVLGILAGMIVIIPYIGSVISVTMGLVVAYGQFGSDGMFWGVVTVYAMGQILESQILTPKIIGDRVGLHPLWMLFGILAGAVLLGFVGVLLAVPLTAVIGVLVKFAVARYLESGLYLDA